MIILSKMFCKISKQIVKAVVPEWIIKKYLNNRQIKLEQSLLGKSPSNVFGAIYKGNMWGKADSEKKFYSGPGSHDPVVVQAYTQKIVSFLKDHPDLTVVDLGCGDFNIGKNFVPLSKKYIACDCVEDLLTFNRQNFVFDNLEFKLCDITTEVIPEGEICFIREVFQHLSNDHIISVLSKLSRYSYVFITEAIPLEEFAPNVDKPTGPFSRVYKGSGVDLRASPFDFVKNSFEISIFWEFERKDSKLRTYFLRNLKLKAS